MHQQQGGGVWRHGTKQDQRCWNILCQCFVLTDTTVFLFSRTWVLLLVHPLLWGGKWSTGRLLCSFSFLPKVAVLHLQVELTSRSLGFGKSVRKEGLYHGRQGRILHDNFWCSSRCKMASYRWGGTALRDQIIWTVEGYWGPMKKHPRSQPLHVILPLV